MTGEASRNSSGPMDDALNGGKPWCREDTHTGTWVPGAEGTRCRLSAHNFILGWCYSPFRLRGACSTSLAEKRDKVPVDHRTTEIRE